MSIWRRVLFRDSGVRQHHHCRGWIEPRSHVEDVSDADAVGYGRTTVTLNLQAARGQAGRVLRLGMNRYVKMFVVMSIYMAAVMCFSKAFHGIPLWRILFISAGTAATTTVYVRHLRARNPPD